MQYNKIYKTILLVAGIYISGPVDILGSTESTPKKTAYFQQTALHGIIRAGGRPAASATVSIAALNKEVMTDEDGRFRLTGLPEGQYQLNVTLVGFKPYSRRVTLPIQDIQGLQIDLEQAEHQLEDILVHGRTRVQEVNRQAYNVTALDATKLYNTTIDIGHALDRVSGIRVRESGGVGSDMNLSINGFSGRQIKIFIDGVPMEGFGSAFQINNIPINSAERVEVYRGVVPVWLGADAMGGAINIVTSTAARSFLDASYSHGSFNTHRTNINAGWTTASGFTAQINAYQNYSDNDYKMTINPSDINTGISLGEQRIRRFHDKYHNEAIIAQVGVVNKKYADRLLVGVQLGQTFKEIQTGARIESVFGDWYRKGNIVMPTLKYQKKDLFVKGLTATVNANINLGNEQNIDTVNVRYDWYGQAKYGSGLGSERSRSLYRYSNNTGIGTATFNYEINDRHTVVLNNVFTTFDRKGSDELYPENEHYEMPSKTQKNTTGVSYQYNHDGKWSISALFKNYFQALHYTSTSNPSGNWGDVAYNTQDLNYNRIGYGVAGTYFFTPDLQIKASYENAKRMPEAEEIFGDLINTATNLELKPESSNNYNLGVSYLFRVKDDHRFSVDAGWLYRDAHDFIRQRLNANQTMYIMENLAAVTNMGVDGEVRYSYRNRLTAGASMSYHNFRNNTKYEAGQTEVSLVYRDRMPNIPYLFGNFDVSLFFNKLGSNLGNLSVGYNLLYVNRIYLFWPSQGQASTKRSIPTQLSHDVNVVYSMRDGRYNIGLECKNLTDALVYDNFSLPKPSRGVFLKLRYFIQN